MAIGLAVTCLLTILAGMGWLGRLERVAFDQRARWFARHTPRPSPRIVHVDIDDHALARIGRWPWPRIDLAHVTDELRRAGAKVVAFDLLLDEPQQPRYQRMPASPAGNAPVQFDQIYDDLALAKAISEHGNVVLAAYMTAEVIVSPDSRRAIDLLKADLQIDQRQLAAQMNVSGQAFESIRVMLVTLKSRAAEERIEELQRELGTLPTIAQCRDALLPRLDPSVIGAPELGIIEQQLARRQAINAVVARLPDSALPPDHVTVNVPIAPLAQACAAIGSVTYEADADGAVRSVPLWIIHEGKQYPYFALMIACRFLDVPIDSARIEGNWTIIPNAPRPDGSRRDLRLPMIQVRPGEDWQYLNRRLLVTWPTTSRQWLHLLDPRAKSDAQHLPIGPLVELHRLREHVQQNERAADAALAGIFTQPALTGLLDESLAQKLTALLDPQAEPSIADRQFVRQQVATALKFVLDDFKTIASPTPEESRLISIITTGQADHEKALSLARDGRQTIEQYESELRRRLEGAVCLVGWTATGSLADFVPTALNERTPGVVVHGAVLNAILTDHFLSRSPLWVDLAITLMLGLLVTFITARFTPIGALAMSIGLVGGWFAVSGMVLFDQMDMQVAAAGPTAAAGCAWVAITLYRLIIEQRERARITRQFKNYVSGDLVDLIVANPTLIKQGEHELTIMFSDIAGFTTLSESLGTQRTIGLLNEYLSQMTRRLMEQRATVNKYLGDGIMAFWNAPLDDDQHTLNACQSVLGCIDAMKQFGNDPRFKDLPTLFMRVGIATGPVVVGDCGAPPDRSDYTVIGNTANLAARLESANKQFDTQILINDRAQQLVSQQMLTRPVGKIQVVGKKLSEPVHELLCTWEQATDEKRTLARLTAAMVSAYQAGQFEQCISHAGQLAQSFGSNKLTALYMQTCQEFLSQGKPDDFDGALVLTQK